MQRATKELSDELLDLAVALADGWRVTGERWVIRRESEEVAQIAKKQPNVIGLNPPHYSPTSDWNLGGPIVEKHWLRITNQVEEWFGPDWSQDPVFVQAPLMWLLRGYVGSKFGEQVDLTG